MQVSGCTCSLLHPCKVCSDHHTSQLKNDWHESHCQVLRKRKSRTGGTEGSAGGASLASEAGACSWTGVSASASGFSGSWDTASFIWRRMSRKSSAPSSFFQMFQHGFVFISSFVRRSRCESGKTGIQFIRIINFGYIQNNRITGGRDCFDHQWQIVAFESKFRSGLFASSRGIKILPSRSRKQAR